MRTLAAMPLAFAIDLIVDLLVRITLPEALLLGLVSFGVSVLIVGVTSEVVRRRVSSRGIR